MFDWRDRKFKEYTREMATAFSLRRFPLFLPAEQALCLQQAESSGMVSKLSSTPILVERDQKKLPPLQKTLVKTGWHRRCRLHGGELHDLHLPWSLDYAWIDLNGTIGDKLGEWIATEFSANLTTGAVFCLTHQYCWRNNDWLKDIRQQVLDDPLHEKLYANFRHEWHVYEDKYLAFPAFLIFCLLRNWSVKMLRPYRYFDTIDMVFYQFYIAERQQRPTYPVVYGSQSLVRRSKDVESSTSSEVIEALLNAKKPADKAHATRKLRAYAAQKVSEGKNERQVVAAIKAHVTRRKKAASA